MVETLIRKAMSHGELENLPGAGKPLKAIHDDPFTDTTTKKINEIMIREG